LPSSHRRTFAGLEQCSLPVQGWCFAAKPDGAARACLATMGLRYGQLFDATGKAGYEGTDRGERPPRVTARRAVRGANLAADHRRRLERKYSLLRLASPAGSASAPRTPTSAKPRPDEHRRPPPNAGDACAALLAAGQPVTFDDVATRAGLGRATLYRNSDLRAVVDEDRARGREAPATTPSQPARRQLTLRQPPCRTDPISRITGQQGRLRGHGAGCQG
jgi:hypothetical protein